MGALVLERGGVEGLSRGSVCGIPVEVVRSAGSVLTQFRRGATSSLM